jgi:hypothetical protein
LNFKGAPSQEEHKTIFSGLSKINCHLLGQSDTTALFSTVRNSLCDTYFDFPQYGVRPSYGAKAAADAKMTESQFDQTKLSHLSLGR